MSYSPEQVLKIIKKAKRKHRQSESEIGNAWIGEINRNLATLLKFGEENLKSSSIVAASIRNLSSYPKDKIPTLYVSEMYLRHLDDPSLQDGLALDEKGDCFEHVVPIKFILPEKAFLLDLATALAAPNDEEMTQFPWLNKVAQSTIMPVCYISQHENIRIDRLSHPDWTRPFKRYCDPLIIRDAPEKPIKIYETATGKEIQNLAEFSWGDHFTQMENSTVYSIGLNFVRRYFTEFSSERQDFLETLSRKSRPDIWPQASAERKSAGNWSVEERYELRQLAKRLAGSGPQIDGKSAIEVPVGRERVTITVRHPKRRKVLVRINIGPTYSKREIYFNDERMDSAGRLWIDMIANSINGQGLHFQLNPQTKNNNLMRAYDISYKRNRQGSHTQMVSYALQHLISELVRLYYKVSDGNEVHSH